MPRTITSLYANGLTLTNTGDDPLSIGAGGIVLNGSGTALQSSLGFYWTITNGNTVQATGTTAGSGSGIALAGGAALTNLTGARIGGYGFGVSIAGAGTVVNQGSIGAAQTATPGFSYSATTHVFTALSAGVFLNGGGVSNAAGGVISSPLEGVVLGAAGSVVNAGSITAASTTQGFGIVLGAGGGVTNTSGGVISAGRYGIFTLGTAAVVNQAGGTITSPFAGVVALNAVNTVTNLGSISGSGNAGINLLMGGAVTNAAGGAITSGNYGIRVAGTAGAVTNAGTVFSSRTQAGAGIALLEGGSATNSMGGIIAGKWLGLQSGHFPAAGGAHPAASAPITFVNQGSVFASDGANGAAVWLNSPGVVLNDTSGVIAGDTSGTIIGGPLNGVHAGAFGIVAYYQTTLTNRGTIGGTNFAFSGSNNNTAVSVANLIQMTPDARFLGAVKGATKPADAALTTLELMAGASAGAITNFGTTIASAGHLLGYINFGRVTLDDGARWSLGGTVASGTTINFAGTTGQLTLANPALMQGTIIGFNAGETLSLAGLTDVTGVTLTAGNTLTVTESAGPGLTLRFDPAQSFSGTFGQALVGGATSITVSCFASGTLIRTPDGAVPVEHLRPGLRVLTQRGESVEIVWTGHRTVDCRHHPDPATVCPVRVRAGAFGPGLPSRDLLLSPDHALFVDDVLIPVRHLITGGAIRQMVMAEVTYHHIELPAHDVILAEGLPVESYLDTGGRANFGTGGVVRLFPDFNARLWEMAGCAPLVSNGPVLERVKRGLIRRETEGTVPVKARADGPRF